MPNTKNAMCKAEKKIKTKTKKMTKRNDEKATANNDDQYEFPIPPTETRVLSPFAKPPKSFSLYLEQLKSSTSESEKILPIQLPKYRKSAKDKNFPNKAMSLNSRLDSSTPKSKLNNHLQVEEIRTRAVRSERKAPTKSSRHQKSKKEICKRSPIEKFVDKATSPLEFSEWLSGGPLGSRQAVLVFRACALSKSSHVPELLQPLRQTNDEIFRPSDEHNEEENKTIAMKDSISKKSTSDFDSDCIQTECLRSSTESFSARSRIVELKNSSTEPCAEYKDVTYDVDPNDPNVRLLPPEEMPGRKLNMSFKACQTETKLLAALLKVHGCVEVPDDCDVFNLLWTGVHLKPDLLGSLASHQRINHFPRSYEITRKDRLYKNIEQMQRVRGIKNFDFIPQTFIMPSEFRELNNAHIRSRGPWIVKPVAASRGRGIYIVSQPDAIPLEEPLVVAKYILDPLLIEGHKCDLRLYVLVTSLDPLLIYLYEEGLVRLATVKYDKTGQNLWNPCMHLCNYSINKFHTDFVTSEKATDEDVGHKWTVSALLRQLRAKGHDTALLMAQIEDLIIKSLLSSTHSMESACKMFMPHPNNCFELFGFDILIDDKLKPWLLEINLSPSLNCDTPLDVRVKSTMLSDLLTLVGLPAISPIRQFTPSQIIEPKAKGKNVNRNRRVHSADFIVSSSRNRVELTSTRPGLTLEEQRVLRNAKAQFSRRGGFVRVFPTVDTMHKYGQYLDPITGIPSHNRSSTSHEFGRPVGYVHNYNHLLHNHLFINEQPPMGLSVVSPGRMLRYERMLKHGNFEELRKYGFGWTAKRRSSAGKQKSSEEKSKIIKLMDKRFHLTQVQARKAFSQYLSGVLRRISNTSPATVTTNTGHTDLVLKFLQRASAGLKTPMTIKIPNQKQAGKDRDAMIAKQLSDFLYQYNRETELYSTGDKAGHVPNTLFANFLLTASEHDLEDILMLQAQAQGNPSSFLDSRTYSTAVFNSYVSSNSLTSPKFHSDVGHSHASRMGRLTSSKSLSTSELSTERKSPEMPKVLALLRSLPFVGSTSSLKFDTFKRYDTKPTAISSKNKESLQKTTKKNTVLKGNPS